MRSIFRMWHSWSLMFSVVASLIAALPSAAREPAYVTEAFGNLERVFAGRQTGPAPPTGGSPSSSSDGQCPSWDALAGRVERVQPKDLELPLAELERAATSALELHGRIRKTLNEANRLFAQARGEFYGGYAKGKSCYPDLHQKFEQIERLLKAFAQDEDATSVVERNLVCADRAVGRVSDLTKNEKSPFAKAAFDRLLQRATAVRSRLTDLSQEFPVTFEKRDRLFAAVEELRAAAIPCR